MRNFCFTFYTIIVVYGCECFGRSAETDGPERFFPSSKTGSFAMPKPDKPFTGPSKTAQAVAGPLEEGRKPSLDDAPPTALIDYTPMPPYIPLFASENIAAHLGYEPGDIIGNPSFLTNTIHPEDLPQLLSGLFHLFIRGYHVYEYRFLRKNGTYSRMLAELHLIRSHGGTPLKITCFLAEPLSFAGEIQDAPAAGPVPAGEKKGVIELTIDGGYRIRRVSSSIEKILEYRPTEVVGRFIHEFIPPDYLTISNKVLTRLLECCQDTVHFWTAAKHRDGSLRFLANECKGQFDERGNRIIVATCHNISHFVRVRSAPVSRFPGQAQASGFRGRLREPAEETADPLKTLTAREREVLYLTVEGHSSTRIGMRLSISPRTVEAHRASLMKKLRVRSIPQLIRYTICRIAYPAAE